MIELLILLTLFQIKHFICDFPLQKPYQFLNKGIYGHFGGILHAFIHGLGTVMILSFFTPHAAIFATIDMILHYHIDWAKVKINKYYGLKADNSEKFWWLLGLDQMLHQLTYIGIIACL
jgi:hypothetical protein